MRAPPRTLLPLATAIMLVTLFVSPASAKVKIGDKGIDRPGNTAGWWCPSHFDPINLNSFADVPFTADGPEITVEFEVLISDTAGVWLKQALDNIAIVTKAVYDSNNAVLSHSEMPCTVPVGKEAFLFHTVSPSAIHYFEPFHDSIPFEWTDLDNVWYNDSAHCVAFPSDCAAQGASGPNDLANPTWISSGGSLAFGHSSDTDSTATATLSIGGLTKDAEYVLHFWWLAKDTPMPVSAQFQIYGTQYWTDITRDGIAGDDWVNAVAWADYDGDDDLDAYLSQNGTNRLLRNDGNGVFWPVDAGANGDSSNTTSAAWGDYDNDGDPDLYIGNFGAGNALFRNDGGAFVNVSTPTLKDTGNAIHVSWADFENDGYLDLLAVNTSGQSNIAWKNIAGSFAAIPVGSLLLGSWATGGAWADFDNDGDLDFCETENNGNANHLHRNDGASVFVDATPFPVGGGVDDSYGAAWSDFDNDGDLDLFVANSGTLALNRIYDNLSNGDFEELVEPPYWGNGAAAEAAAGDYDADGFIDVYTPNVLISEHQLFRNPGAGPAWFEASLGSPLGGTAVGGGAAWADVDADGDLDLMVTSLDQGAKLIRNDYVEKGEHGHWLQIDLEGTISNRDAIGARVTVYTRAPDGSTETKIREVGGDTGSASHGPRRLTFGLGDRTFADRIDIQWPSGLVESVAGVAADHRYEFVEGNVPTAVETAPLHPVVTTAMRNAPNPFNPITRIQFALAAPARATLRILDASGRVVRTLASDRVFPAGIGEVVWNGAGDDGRAVASGVYFSTLETAGARSVRKMTLIR